MAETYDDKAILGAQLETLATDMAKDIAYKDAYAGKWIGIARTATTTVNNAVYWPLFSFTRFNDYFSLQLEVDVTNGAFDTNVFETKIIDLGGYTQGSVEWANEIRICHKRVYSTRGYGNVIYYTMSNNVVTVYIKSACKANETQFCRLNKVVSQNSITNLTWYSVDTPPEQPSSPTKFTEVIGGNLVDVSSYTTYASILAVVNAGGLPYYHYTSGNTAIDLTFAGTRAIPNVGMVLDFNAVQNNTIYYVGFAGSSSSFGTVRTFPLFSSDNVKTSSDTSSWSSDNTNVPTRAAVESKISSAMSGSLGGFLGSMSPNDISLYQISGHTFLKGDWFVVSESGTAYYYPNNDRSASSITLNLLEGDEYYWTTSGTLVKKPSTALQIYSISSLSDWNNLTSPGLYKITSQSGSVDNSPISGRVSCLVSESDGAIGQIAFGNSSGISKVFYRSKPYNNAWSDWKDNSVFYATIGDSGTSGGTSFNDLKAAYNSGNTIFAVRSLLNGMSNTLFNLESVIKDGNGVVTSFRFVALHIGDTTNNGDLEVWSRNSSSWMYISSMVREANSAIFAKDYLTGQGGTIESELKARTTIASSTTEVAKAVGASAGSVISVILGSNYGGATSGSTATVENVLKFYVKDDFNAVNGQFYAILRNGGSVTTLTCSSGSQTISDGKFVMVMCLKVGSTVTYHFKE